MSNLRVPFSASRSVPHFLLIHFDAEPLLKAFLMIFIKSVIRQNILNGLLVLSVAPSQSV